MRLQRYAMSLTMLVGLGMLGAGVWALVAPDSFADAVDFPRHRHFVHDLGAFQLGLGATLLLALVWADALATALAGFLVANTAHAVNHAVDRHLGGRSTDWLALAVVSVLVAIALVLRLRQLGWVVGRVGVVSSATLAGYLRQKTIRLTSYRRNGSPVGTAVSIAVDGDRAVVRSFERAGKTGRIRRNGTVEIAPSTARGRPTGPPLQLHARLLDGAESAAAGRLLARKYPLLHGVTVPLSHRLLRAKAGRTVHFELTP